METLKQKLQQLDGQGYKSYKVLQGAYRFENFELIIDHVQGDPFSNPSRIRLRLDSESSALPPSTYDKTIRRIALEDFLCRSVTRAIQRHVKGNRGTGHSGEIRIAPCGQQVLVRDALLVNKGEVEARLGLALPAAGRRILAGEAMAMFFVELPNLVAQGLQYPQLDPMHLEHHLNSIEDQEYLRNWLASENLVAFVGDGATLPRRSGIDDRPLDTGAVSFESPSSLAREPELPHNGKVRGMGIPVGVTLIVGGGFHGKSTLLQALERGIYNHIPGDGRERVVCDPSAFKIRAEDGRSVNRVDISGFINNLPLGQDTLHFSTQNASGSTSQAANIIEALCSGSMTLLIDEDTSATNFMIRDRRMQMLVAPEREPITPLIQRIRELYKQQGVSTLLVTGGSSAYFDVADRVLMMDHYRAQDVTDQARKLSRPFAPPPNPTTLTTTLTASRRLTAHGLQLLNPELSNTMPFNQRKTGGSKAVIKVQAQSTEQLRIGHQCIDLGRVEQLVEVGQLLAIGYLICQLEKRNTPSHKSPRTDNLLLTLEQLLNNVRDQGLDDLSPFGKEPHGGLSLPRLQELFAAINRLRSLPLE